MTTMQICSEELDYDVKRDPWILSMAAASLVMFGLFVAACC